MLPAVPPIIPGNGIFKSLQSNDTYLNSISGQLVNTLNIWKGDVIAASTGNVALFGLQSMDGVNLGYGDIVLLKNQTNPKNNGIYTVTDTEWTRSPNLVDGTNASGVAVYIVSGSQNEGKIYVCTNDSGNDVVGIVALTFATVSNGGTNYQLFYNSNGVLTADESSTDGAGNISASSIEVAQSVVATTYSDTNSVTFGLNRGFYFNDVEIRNGASKIQLNENVGLVSNVPIIATRFKLDDVVDNTDYSFSYSNPDLLLNITGSTCMSLGPSEVRFNNLTSPFYSFTNDQDTSINFTNNSISLNVNGTENQLTVSNSYVINEVPYYAPNYYSSLDKITGIESSGTDISFLSSSVSLVVMDTSNITSVVPIVSNELKFDSGPYISSQLNINDVLKLNNDVVSEVPVSAYSFLFQSDTMTGLVGSVETIDMDISNANKLKIDNQVTSEVQVRSVQSFAFYESTGSGLSIAADLSFMLNDQTIMTVSNGSTTVPSIDTTDSISAVYYQSNQTYEIGTNAPLTLINGLHNLNGTMTSTNACGLFYVEENQTYFVTGKVGNTDPTTVYFSTIVYRLNGNGIAVIGSPIIGSVSNLTVDNVSSPPILQLTDSNNQSYIVTVFV